MVELDTISKEGGEGCKNKNEERRQQAEMRN